MDPAAAEEPRYAGFWIRVGATLIDTILVALVTAPILYAVYGAAYFSPDSVVTGPVDFLLSWVAPAIAVVMFWLLRRATPGKMAFSAEIVDARTGATLSTGQAIGRYLGYFVSIVPLFLGLLWVAFDKRKQGWHDKLAGTVVVIRRKPGTP